MNERWEDREYSEVKKFNPHLICVPVDQHRRRGRPTEITENFSELKTS